MLSVLHWNESDGAVFCFSGLTMPINSSMSAGAIIKELHTGSQFQRTKAKHGSAVAQKQAIAIALKEKREHPRAAKKP